MTRDGLIVLLLLALEIAMLAWTARRFADPPDPTPQPFRGVYDDERETMARIDRSLGHRPKPIRRADVIVRPASPYSCVYVVAAVHDDYVQTTNGCRFERSRLGDHPRRGAFTLLL